MNDISQKRFLLSLIQFDLRSRYNLPLFPKPHNSYLCVFQPPNETWVQALKK